MVSNALSARRGPLRRPKVCLTHPNPGRCEPPPPPPNGVTCSVLPVEFTINQLSIQHFDCEHCKPALPLDTFVVITGEVDSGVIVGDPPSFNCQTGGATYFPDATGDWPILFTYTFSDFTICQVSSLAHVTGFGP